MRIEIKARESVHAYLDGVQRDIMDSLVGIVAHTAENIKNDTRNEMKNGKKSGNWYTYLGRRYRASAVGEVPAVRSGDLYRSIRIQKKNAGLSATIGTPITYAIYLKVKRPVLDFGLDKNVAKFINDLRRIV